MPAQLTHEGVFPVVLEALALQVGISTALPLSTTLQDDLGMDSLEIVELGVVLEKKFNIVVPDAQLRACVTLEDVTRVILMAESDRDRE